MIGLIHNHADQHQNEVVLSFDQSLLSSFSLFLLPNFLSSKFRGSGTQGTGQASPDEVHIRGADTKCERIEQGGGPGVWPRKKFLRSHSLDRWKVPLFVKKSPLKGAVELD